MKKIIKWILLILGLILFNLLILECLLRVGGLFENIAESKLDRELKSADYIYDFSPDMKSRLSALELENKFDLASYKKDNKVPDTTVEVYNPYPPILHLFKSSYVIYNKDDKLKQITILSGECNATPSVLVEKARGEWTGTGDHFVTYIFYMNEINGTGARYDTIDWYSWRGGSYDGFEEVCIFPMIMVEILILICWMTIKRKRMFNRLTGNQANEQITR